MDSEAQTPKEPTDFFTADEPSPNEPSTPKTIEGVSWSASEFMNHQKTPAWYLSAAMILGVIGFLYYVLMQDYFGSIAIFVLGGLLMVGANRKPRTLQYRVDAMGISVGGRDYVYDDFQSFAIIKEDSIESIMLTPQKRWASIITLYFDPNDGQKIFEVLSTFLPLEERTKDTIDKFLHKIRF